MKCIICYLYIYIYSFSRHFYPKRLPRESFTKVHRSLIITTRFPKTLQVVKHEAYIVKKTKISAKGKNHKSMKLNKLQLNNMDLKSARVYL